MLSEVSMVSEVPTVSMVLLVLYSLDMHAVVKLNHVKRGLNI